MTEFDRYNHWLKVVCKLYHVTHQELLRRGCVPKRITAAKLLLYILCIRDNITLKDLNYELGFSRGAMHKFLWYHEETRIIPPKLVNMVFNTFYEKI